MQPVSTEFGAMNNINRIPSLQEIHHRSQMLASSQLDPPTPHDDFLHQILSSVPSSAGPFPWADDDHAPPHLEDQSASALASKMRQHQISNGAAKALTMLQQQQQQQQQLFLNAANGLLSPTGSDGSLLHDVGDGNSFMSGHPANDASVEALLNGLTGSLGQSSNQPHHFHNPEAQNFGAAMNQPAASGGAAAGQPRQRVRARRGQATDPHSIAERLRRERIAERMKALQELVPNANKIDKASMLDEIIDYVKFLQLQVKVLSMSRLGGAAGAVKPLGADMSPQGKSGNGGTQTASSPNSNDGMTVTENQVAKLMEEDMGSAMQYLQGKGLCLMPISLATAISTATSHSRNPLPPLSPTSPNLSALTVQSATMGGGEYVSRK